LSHRGERRQITGHDGSAVALAGFAVVLSSHGQPSGWTAIYPS